jgi:thiamine-monophosphate kinase
VANKDENRAVSGELSLIEAIRRRSARGRAQQRGLRVGIGDDCAVLRPKAGHEICVTTDFSLEGVHFRRDWHAPQSAGHRCLARGLSDLAAMGAEPLGIFLSLALPAGISQAWVDGFVEGLLGLAARHGVALAGGDTAQSPGGIAADIVAVGQVPRGKALLRSGARPGDGIYVTGALGGAAAELVAVERSPRQFRGIDSASAGHPHLFPEPRLAAGRKLRGVASAAIDVSDGPSTDLTHLCEESGVGAVFEAAALPVDSLAVEVARRGWVKSAIELALHGGEDYELLFTAGPKARVPRKIGGVMVSRIGTVRRVKAGTAKVVLKTADGRGLPLQATGWEHFRKRQG